MHSLAPAFGRLGRVRVDVSERQAGSDESPEETALREVLEETGIEAEITGEIRGWFASGLSTTHFYWMRALRETGNWNRNETQAVEWVPLAEAHEWIGKTRNAGGSRAGLGCPGGCEGDSGASVRSNREGNALNNLGMNRPRLDIIGDVHGQLGALRRLGTELGYAVDGNWSHPEGRRPVFIGDLVDRGPHSFEVSELVRGLCADGFALCLLGNHELNLIEWRHGRTKPKGSNRDTIQDIECRPELWNPVLDFFEGLPLALEFVDLG